YTARRSIWRCSRPRMPTDRQGPVLLTGAAGKLGAWLRQGLAGRAHGLRSTDIRAFGPALAGETIELADLADAEAVDRLLDGVAAVVHFGAVSAEDSFDTILRSNIIGTQNVFEA